MKQIIYFGLLVFLLTSCDDHDKWTWNNRTVPAPDLMARCNADIDESKWPADNRTGNPAYHLKKEKELREHMQAHPQNNSKHP